MAHVRTTNGVVLDPFSIHLTGLTRKHNGVKTGFRASELFANVHGEAKFKQAFVNACHFAESMTVVGPVAQVAWDLETPSSITQALMFKGDVLKGGNEAWVNTVQAFLKKAKWDKVKGHNWLNGDKFSLHTLPDFSLTREIAESDRPFLPYESQNNLLNRHLFRRNMSGGTTIRQNTVEKFEAMSKYHSARKTATVTNGMPTLGLMAVIFTFKKPCGILKINELTNLASWPPVVFFLPVMVPAGTSLSRKGSGLITQATRQPALSTYRISLDTHKHILPYAQPFFLSSVREQGKAPDTLRSLSDVFKALWSQATQWSTWNMAFEADLEAEPFGKYITRHSPEWKGLVGELCLDPLGAGRRIRGHNRHMSKYDITDATFLWEDTEMERKLMAFNPAAVDKRPFQRQLRSSLTGKYETIFVLPSFMGGDTSRNMGALAMTMARFMYGQKTGLEGFLMGDLMANTNPEVCGSGGVIPTERPESFMDGIHKAMGNAEDTLNKGAIPVHRVKADLSFDPEGDPNVFGLSMPYSVVQEMNASVETQPTKEKFEEMASETGRMSNFHFTEAFCSKSTKDLTEVFGEVKEKSFKEGSKAKELLDESLAIDLFDENLGMI